LRLARVCIPVEPARRFGEVHLQYQLNDGRCFFTRIS
jgi:hypothetical protein